MWVSPKTSESPSGFRCWSLRNSRRQVHRPSGLIWSPWNLIMLVSFAWIVFVASSVHDDLNVDLQTTHTAFSKINLVKWSRNIKNILHFASVENWPSECGESKGLWELPPHSGVMHITLLDSSTFCPHHQPSTTGSGPAGPPCRIRSTVQWNQLDPRLSHHNLKKLGWKGTRWAPLPNK